MKMPGTLFHLGARPLYLHKGSAKRLDLDSTNRLRIERKDGPDRRIPLHHVSRIICSSNLDISSRTLMTCMQHGIPLAILNSDSTPLGWCFGTRRKETSLRQLLNFALDDPTWPTLYKDWLVLERLAISVHTLLACGVPSTASARQNPRVALCNAHFRQHRRACSPYIDELAMLAQVDLAFHLEKETSDLKLLAWHRPGLNLIFDLGQLLSLYAHTDLHHAPQLPNHEQITIWAIRRYEMHIAHWQQRIAQLMYDFEQFLRANWL